jgi:citrate (Si)-synthase
MPDYVKQVLGNKAEQWRKDREAYLKAAKDEQVFSITKSNILGMRMPARFSYTSRVLPDGLFYQGIPVQQFCNDHPQHLLTERTIMLFLLGENPNDEMMRYLSTRLQRPLNQKIPGDVYDVVRPMVGHPAMNVLCAAMAALDGNSAGQKIKDASPTTDQRWRVAIDDFFSLLAQMPRLIGLVLRTVRGDSIDDIRHNYWRGDLGAAYAKYLGLDGPKAAEFMSLFLTLHACHETGPASTNTAMTAGNAYSTLYQSLVAGFMALAGDRHGGANDRALGQLESALLCCSKNPDQIGHYYQTQLLQGGLVYGFGHPVYEDVDPRHIIFLAWLEEHFPNSKLLRIIQMAQDVVPPLLKAKGASPYPNVDLCSGTLLHEYGFDDVELLPVLFAASRMIGMSINIILARLFCDPLDRPETPYWDRSKGELSFTELATKEC